MANPLSKLNGWQRLGVLFSVFSFVVLYAFQAHLLEERQYKFWLKQKLECQEAWLAARPESEKDQYGNPTTKQKDGWTRYWSFEEIDKASGCNEKASDLTRDYSDQNIFFDLATMIAISGGLILMSWIAVYLFVGIIGWVRQGFSQR